MSRYGNSEINIKALKGSSSKIIVPIHYTQYFVNCRQSGVSPFAGFNRFFVYRLFQKLNLFIHFETGLNNAVTHSLRFASIRLLSNSKIPLLERSKFVGHKSQSNTIYYEEKH